MPGRRLGIQAHTGMSVTRPSQVVTTRVQFGLAAGSPTFVATFHSSNYTAYANLAATARCQIMRFDYQNGAGTNFKSLYDACVAAGIDVLPIIMIRATSSVATVQSWATDLVSRYPNVKKVELGNEVNGASQYAGTVDAADYTPKAQAAATILRAGLPGVKLCSSGLSQGGGLPAAQTYLQGMIDNGIDASVDAYGVHAYGSFGRTTFLQGLRSTLVSNGLSAKPIWVTECGGATSGGTYSGLTEAQQATEVTTCFSTFTASGYVDDFHVYSNVDHATTGGVSDPSDQEHYGIWDTAAITSPVGNDKLAMAAFQAGIATYGH